MRPEKGFSLGHPLEKPWKFFSRAFELAAGSRASLHRSQLKLSLQEIRLSLTLLTDFTARLENSRKLGC